MLAVLGRGLGGGGQQMPIPKISSGGVMSTCKISTGGANVHTKNKLGGWGVCVCGGGADVRVTFSTGGQMSIYTFFHWWADVLGGQMPGDLFNRNFLIFFLFLHKKNKYCGHSLEVPQQGTYN